MTDPRPIAAAIDIGSNSIKMTVGRPDGAGGIDQIEWASETVRLGQGVDETGRLDDKRIEAALETLGRFAARARELGASRLVAVATEATRAAANGPVFLEQVERETGIEVRLVDGHEEAMLTFRGLAATADLSGQVVIADIGGGSTELIVANDGEILGARSIPLGSGRLTDRLGLADPPTNDELAASEAEADSAIARAARSLTLPRGEGVRLLVVGGTGEFMARLVPDDQPIDRAALGTILGKLAVLTAAELADAIEIPEARARVLPAGVAIVAAIANRVEPDRIEVAPSGIRAGLLIDAFGGETHGVPATAHESNRPPDEPEQKARSTATEPVMDEARSEEPAFRAAMQALIARGWEDVWSAIPAALEGNDSEAVHDVRVASRRLRAAMETGAPVFPKRWYRPLHRAAKAITRALGDVRDRDVMLESFRAERERAPVDEQPGIDRLIARVEHERAAARAEMERFLQDLLAGPLWPEIERRFDARRPSKAPVDAPQRGEP